MCAVLSESVGATPTIRTHQAEIYFLRIYENHLNPSDSAAIMHASFDTWVIICAGILLAVPFSPVAHSVSPNFFLLSKQGLRYLMLLRL